MMIYNPGFLRAFPFYLLGCKWWIVAINFLLGALPDLYPLPEVMKGNYSNMYKTAHRHWAFWILSPLHLAIDSFTHSDKGWTKMGYWFDGFVTAFFLTVIFKEIINAIS